LKICRIKSIATARAFVLMLTIAAALIAIVPVTAQEKEETMGFVCVAPKIVGLGQQVVVTTWTYPQPPLIPGAIAASGFGIGKPRYNYTLTFIKPNDQTDVVVMGPSFGEGTAFAIYVPDQTGDWSVTLYWAGDENFTECTSPPFTFTVQEEAAYSYWPDTSLPDYWTRPINAENRLGYLISGDWLNSNYNSSGSKYNPYCIGPGSAHILWKWNKDWQGGLIGGEDFMTMAYSSASERSGLSVSKIWAGKAYINWYDGVHCIDVHTGEELWVRSFPLGTFVIIPTWDYLHDMPEYMGGEQPYAHAFDYVSTAGEVRIYDPIRGTSYKNITGPGAGFNSYDEYHGYFYRYDNGYLIKWDPAKEIGMGFGMPGTNFTELIVYNVSAPTYPTRFYGDMGISTAGGYITSFDLDTGAVLYREPYTGGYMTSMVLANGKLFSGGNQRMTFDAWNADNGLQAWTSEPSEYPYGFFWAYGIAAAGPGHFYMAGYDGHVYAYNSETGKIDWAFYAGDSGLETPYNTWPFWNNIVTAGPAGAARVYAGNGEHTPAQPAWKGQRLYCIDDNTGEEIWHIAMSPLDKIVADGVLMCGNYYDGLLYAFSKGPTATTVSASPSVISKGSTVLIEGTVMDQSPAQPGTPCISRESMTEWMEFLHMQKPCPLDVTGVLVDLRAMRSDGSLIEIGTATSDYAGTFKYMWTPPDEDVYTISATFDGSESYGGSWATTGLGVTEAPPEPIEPAVQEDIDQAVDNLNDSFTPMFLGLIVAVVVAIVIGVVNLWALRRRK